MTHTQRLQWIAKRVMIWFRRKANDGLMKKKRRAQISSRYIRRQNGLAFDSQVTKGDKGTVVVEPFWPYPIWHHARGGPISVSLMTGQQLRSTRNTLGRWLAEMKGNEVIAMWWSVMDDEIARRIQISRGRLDSRKRLA